MYKYNIVFLDFDGLLNNIPELISRQRKLINGQTKEYDLKLKSTEGLDEFWANEMCWNNFQPIIKCLSQIQNLKIVISSSWRNYKNVEKWNHQFSLIEGWNFEIIDITPKRLDCDKEVEIIGGFKSVSNRGKEIQCWLDNHSELFENYCILDDENDMLVSQINNFVQTNQDVGFCDEDIYKVWKIFDIEGGNYENRK